MMLRQLYGASAILGLLCFTCVASSGCGEKGPTRKKTYPVTGQVYVDGQPAAGVAITLHELQGMDKDLPTVSQVMTDEQGKFAVATYEEGDGAPEGEYTMTFVWGELNLMSMQYDGDKLGGKFSDPQKSEFRVKVETQPVELGRLDLKTK